MLARLATTRTETIMFCECLFFFYGLEVAFVKTVQTAFSKLFHKVALRLQ